MTATAAAAIVSIRLLLLDFIAAAAAAAVIALRLAETTAGAGVTGPVGTSAAGVAGPVGTSAAGVGASGPAGAAGVVGVGATVASALLILSSFAFLAIAAAAAAAATASSAAAVFILDIVLLGLFTSCNNFLAASICSLILSCWSCGNFPTNSSNLLFNSVIWLLRVFLFTEGVLLFFNFDIKSIIVLRIVFTSPIILLILVNSSVGNIAGAIGATATGAITGVGAIACILETSLYTNKSVLFSILLLLSLYLTILSSYII